MLLTGIQEADAKRLDLKKVKEIYMCSQKHEEHEV